MGSVSGDDPGAEVQRLPAQTGDAGESAAEGAPSAEAVQTPAPAYRLYSLASAVIASVLGGPVAGGIIVALNFRRLGRSADAWRSLIFGAVAFVICLVVGRFAPAGTGMPLAIAPVIAIYYFMKHLQGRQIQMHEFCNGKMESTWKAAGIGVVCLVVVLTGLVAAIYFTTPSLPPDFVEVGPDQRVYYAQGATRATAEELGRVLKSEGLIGQGESTVVVKGVPPGVEVGFCVKDGAWEKPELEKLFQLEGDVLAVPVGGRPYAILLLNEEGVIKKRIAIR